MTMLNGFMRPLTAGTLAFVTLLGCSRMDEAAVQTERRLRVISVAYLGFAAARGKGPANSAVLKAQLEDSAAAKFLSQELGIVDTATVFSSARDGAPFMLQFGVPIDTSAGKSIAIAYEARGSGGTRFVAFANGRVQCVPAGDVAPISEIVVAQGGPRS